MALGRQRAVQGELLIGWHEVPSAPGHVFYDRMNAVLDGAGFDRQVETLCAPHYAAKAGRPSVPPGRYFRMLFVGYFEGLDSERGIAWPSRRSKPACRHGCGRAGLRQGLSRSSSAWPTAGGRRASPSPPAGACCAGTATARAGAVYANRARLLSGVTRVALLLRAVLCERAFAHILDRGGMRRTWLRGRDNVAKRYLVQVAGYNLRLLMRTLFGAGTLKAAADAGLVRLAAGDHLLLLLLLCLKTGPRRVRDATKPQPIGTKLRRAERFEE